MRPVSTNTQVSRGPMARCTKLAATADPDGYTLLIGATSFVLSFSLYPNLDYDPVKSFAPVAMLAYSPQVLVEEHRFVPKPGAKREDDGWLVGTALDAGRGEHLLSVFEARDVASGPVCQARLPRMLPLSFHAEFAPG